MGNLPLFGLFRASPMSEDISGGRFMVRRIRSGVMYYYAPFSGAEVSTLCPAKESQILHLSTSSSSPLLSDSPSHTPASTQNHSDSTSTSRPLLLFFSWLGARLEAVAKYRDLYLDRGMDVLVVQSNVMHFLWPRLGLEYGLEILKVLEEPQFSGRPVLVHATSIGGYTFTQILTHIAKRQTKHAGLAPRVIGHIYDSLVVGTLEHMAIGLGKTLVPRFENVIKNIAMLYFWLFKTHTADLYDRGIQVFNNCPITAPALFFYSENDALCDHVALEKCIDHWRKRGVSVENRKWRESKHAAHMRCHPEDYLSTLEKFLNSMHMSPLKAEI